MIKRSGRRRGRRRASGALAVEVVAGGPSRHVMGRLVDSSAAGFGLVLDAPLPVGSRVRVTREIGRSDDRTTGGATRVEHREGRVAYATQLSGGDYRVGLELEPRPPGQAQVWATRVVLVAVLVLVVLPTLAAGGDSALLGWVLAAILFALAVGSEWQHAANLRAYEAALRQWEEAPLSST